MENEVTQEPQTKNVPPVETQESVVENTNEATPTEVTPEPVEPEKDTEGGGEYRSDYSYKVREESHTFDDWVKPLIKDEETNKAFQDLYTRGHGLELAKNERDEFKSKYNELDESLKALGSMVEKKDSEGFFKALGLPKEMVIDYAIKELQFQDLPEEEKTRILHQKELEEKYSSVEQQNAMLMQQQMNIVRDQRANQLDSILSSSAQEAVNSYDQRTGKPGSFRNLVIERGAYHAEVNGKDLSAAEAVEEALMITGLKAGTPSPEKPEVGTPRVISANDKNVLPNFEGQGKSPVKSGISSLADLKAKRDQLLG